MSNTYFQMFNNVGSDDMSPLNMSETPPISQPQRYRSDNEYATKTFSDLKYKSAPSLLGQLKNCSTSNETFNQGSQISRAYIIYLVKRILYELNNNDEHLSKISSEVNTPINEKTSPRKSLSIPKFEPTRKEKLIYLVTSVLSQLNNSDIVLSKTSSKVNIQTSGYSSNDQVEWSPGTYGAESEPSSNYKLIQVVKQVLSELNNDEDAPKTSSSPENESSHNQKLILLVKRVLSELNSDDKNVTKTSSKIKTSGNSVDSYLQSSSKICPGQVTEHSNHYRRIYMASSELSEMNNFDEHVPEISSQINGNSLESQSKTFSGKSTPLSQKITINSCVSSANFKQKFIAKNKIVSNQESPLKQKMIDNVPIIIDDETLDSEAVVLREINNYLKIRSEKIKSPETHIPTFKTQSNLISAQNYTEPTKHLMNNDSLTHYLNRNKSLALEINCSPAISENTLKLQNLECGSSQYSNIDSRARQLCSPGLSCKASVSASYASSICSQVESTQHSDKSEDKSIEKDEEHNLHNKNQTTVFKPKFEKTIEELENNFVGLKPFNKENNSSQIENNSEITILNNNFKLAVEKYKTLIPKNDMPNIISRQQTEDTKNVKQSPDNINNQPENQNQTNTKSMSNQNSFKTKNKTLMDEIQNEQEMLKVVKKIAPKNKKSNSKTSKTNTRNINANNSGSDELTLAEIKKIKRQYTSKQHKSTEDSEAFLFSYLFEGNIRKTRTRTVYGESRLINELYLSDAEPRRKKRYDQTIINSVSDNEAARSKRKCIPLVATGPNNIQTINNSITDNEAAQSNPKFILPVATGQNNIQTINNSITDNEAVPWNPKFIPLVAKGPNNIQTINNSITEKGVRLKSKFTPPVATDPNTIQTINNITDNEAVRSNPKCILLVAKGPNNIQTINNSITDKGARSKPKLTLPVATGQLDPIIPNNLTPDSNDMQPGSSYASFAKITSDESYIPDSSETVLNWLHNSFLAQSNIKEAEFNNKIDSECQQIDLNLESNVELSSHEAHMESEDVREQSKVVEANEVFEEGHVLNNEEFHVGARSVSSKLSLTLENAYYFKDNNGKPVFRDCKPNIRKRKSTTKEYPAIPKVQRNIDFIANINAENTEFTIADIHAIDTLFSAAVKKKKHPTKELLSLCMQTCWLLFNLQMQNNAELLATANRLLRPKICWVFKHNLGN